MRSLLLVSLLVLAAAWFQHRHVEMLRRADGQVTDLRLYSTGLGLPTPLALRPPGLGAIQCGLVATSAEPNELVLCAAAIDAHGDVTRTARFDLRADPQAVAALEAFCAAAQPGAVLAFAVRGSIQPIGNDGEARAEALDRVFTMLDAECRPHRAPSASWAFGCVHEGRGFTRLGEAFSRRVGVVLALPLTGVGPLGMPKGGWRLIDDEPGSVAPFLVASTAPVRHGIKLADGALDAAELVPDGAAWSLPALKVGAAPRFTASLGLTTLASRTDASARVELLADGVVVASFELVVAADAGHWRDQVVPLDAFADRRVALELRAYGTGLASDARVLIGAPLLHWR